VLVAAIHVLAKPGHQARKSSYEERYPP